MTIVLPAPGSGLGSGSSGIAEPGSGTAVPGGLESVLEYNGLFFNDLSVTDKYRVLSIDGLSGADIRDVREQNPSSHGETAFTSFYGGRTITITGRIEAYSLQKLRDMQQALRYAFADLTDRALVIHTNNVDQKAQVYCRMSQPMAMREEQQGWDFRRDFMITLRAANPRILSLIRPSITAPITTNAATVIATVPNNGNFASEPIIRLSGGFNTGQLTNLTNGQTIKLNGTVSSGDYRDIDVGGRSLKNSAGDNKFGDLDLISDWMTLSPGDNQLEFSAASISGSPSLTVTYRHTWM